MTQRILRALLLLGSVCALLTAQSRPAADARTGYVPLSAATATTGPLAQLVTLNLTRATLGNILSEIARQSRVSFAADPSLPGMTVTRDLSLSGVSAREAIQRALDGSPLHALVSGTGQIIITRKPSASVREESAQQSGARFRLSGYVRSQASGEVVRRAQISLDADAIRIESNEDGYYSVALAAGTHRLRVRAIGFVPKDTTLELTTHVVRDFRLSTRDVVLAAVRVEARQAADDRPDLDPRTPDMSVVRLDLAAVKLLPPVLGEVDPIRSLTLLPGVSVSSDASTSFSVRGGAADQNLFLLDEATIYNPNHILGFLSTFNSDAVDNVTLYKGAIPARFGGRLSSVVDVRQREGNANEFKGTASIGLLASRLALEGPAFGKRGSYMIAARRSYADVFAQASSDSTIRNATAYFYDVNAKTNVRLGASGSLLLSGYLGRDRFGASGLSAGWGNRAATLRWNQGIGGRLFSKVTLATGVYDYLLEFPLSGADSISWRSKIASTDLKIDESYFVSPNNTIEFGLQLTGQQFRPGSVTPRGVGTTFTAREVTPRFGRSPAAYLGQDLKFGDRFALRYGLRWAGFERVGSGAIYKYANNAPVVYSDTLARYQPADPIDTVTYRSGARITSYHGFEPRISGRVMLNDISSIKASYARTQQFLSLASNTNSVTPLDVWEPVGPYIKPQVSDQFAIGYSRTTPAYELSAEAYFKTSSNAIDFIDGADIALNPRVETLIVQGDARAYGLELIARRNTGRWTGWVSYTLGRSEQRFGVPARSGGAAAGGINGGRWYVGPFDKTHNLSVVAVHPLGKRWTLGSTFALASGLPTTVPSARYFIDGLVVAEYTDRNSGRLPLYHRLDLSLTKQFRRGELQLGVLNAYNRFNAQALRFRQVKADAYASEAVQTSIFGIVPSISYVFHF